MFSQSWILLFLISFQGVAQQKQANVWYFARFLGLDFNESPVKVLTDGKIDFYGFPDGESAASICDENGNLLFYTDGVNVWNKEHALMPNGNDLWGSNTTTQTLIVPLPLNDHLFYIFTASPQGNDSFFPDNKKGFRYSIVDLSLQGGLGDVIKKNILLSKSTTEKIAATFHVNQKDIWVVMHECDNNIFRSYRISEKGIDERPVISRTGINHTGGVNGYDDNTIGQMKISPNGELIALVLRVSKQLEVLRFNPLDGKIESWINYSDFNDSDFLYGVEFSSNNHYLYITDEGCNIYQFDLGSNNFSVTKKILVSKLAPICDSPSQLQLAPDEKIYVAKNGFDFIGVINNPNEKGDAVNYDSHGISIPSNGLRYSMSGLPNFISSYFHNPKRYPQRPFLEMPNAFTPNGDNVNESLVPINQYNIRSANLTIYNRWGKKIFGAKSLEKGWKGDNNPAGIYFWHVQYEGLNGLNYSQKGHVQLIR